MDQGDGWIRANEEAGGRAASHLGDLARLVPGRLRGWGARPWGNNACLCALLARARGLWPRRDRLS